MALIFNGTEITGGVFNGTSLSQIVYNGTSVWREISYLTTRVASTSNSSSYSFTVNIGEENPNRMIVVFATGHKGSGWSTCTVNGVGLVRQMNYENVDVDNATFWGVVPTGTSVNISMTAPATQACNLYIYILYGLSTLSPLATAQDTAYSWGTTLSGTHPENSIIMACQSQYRYLGAVRSWTGTSGVTEDYWNNHIEYPLLASGASNKLASSVTNPTIYSGFTTGNGCLQAISFR